MTWSKTVLVIYLFCSSSFFSSSSSSLEISWGGIELLLVQQFESEPTLPSPFWDLINSELSDVVATDRSDMMTDEATDRSDMMTDEVVDMSDIIESLEDTDSIEVLRLTDSLPQLKFEKKLSKYGEQNLNKVFSLFWCPHEATKISTFTKCLIPSLWFNVYKSFLLLPTSKILYVYFFIKFAIYIHSSISTKILSRS